MEHCTFGETKHTGVFCADQLSLLQLALPMLEEEQVVQHQQLGKQGHLPGGSLIGVSRTCCLVCLVACSVSARSRARAWMICFSNMVTSSRRCLKMARTWRVGIQMHRNLMRAPILALPYALPHQGFQPSTGQLQNY